MRFSGLVAALCVTVSVLLANVSVVEGSSPWLRVFDVLPRRQRWRLKLGFGVGWTYLTSDKGREVEEVVERIFELLPLDLKDKTKTPRGEMNLPNNMGYMCWSAGTAEGWKTLVKQGPTEVIQTDGSATVEIQFGYKNLVFTHDICGSLNPMFKKVFRCTVLFGENIFKATFKWNDPDSLTKMAIRVWKRQCLLTFVDVELIHLKGFKIVPTRRSGSKRFSLRNTAVKYSVNLTTEQIKNYIKWMARFHLYIRLKSRGSIICRDSVLEAYFPNYNKKRLERKESDGSGERVMSENYEEVCGSKGASQIEEGEEVEDDDLVELPLTR